jgi:hypothetical protein
VVYIGCGDAENGKLLAGAFPQCRFLFYDCNVQTDISLQCLGRTDEMYYDASIYPKGLDKLVQKYMGIDILPPSVIPLYCRCPMPYETEVKDKLKEAEPEADKNKKPVWGGRWTQKRQEEERQEKKLKQEERDKERQQEKLRQKARDREMEAKFKEVAGYVGMVGRETARLQQENIYTRGAKTTEVSQPYLFIIRSENSILLSNYKKKTPGTGLSTKL